MTYYETAAGARVFSAGSLDFGGSANAWPDDPDAREPLAAHAGTPAATTLARATAARGRLITADRVPSAASHGPGTVPLDDDAVELDPRARRAEVLDDVPMDRGRVTPPRSV